MPQIAPRYTLQEAVEKFFPQAARVTPRGLAAAVRKGRLRAEKVCGQYLVTEQALADFLNACTYHPDALQERQPCHGQPNHPGSTSGPAAKAVPPNGPSSMDQKRLARVRAQTTLRRLSGRSKPTSPASGNRQPQGASAKS